MTMSAAAPAPAGVLRRFAYRWLAPLRYALILTIPLSMRDAPHFAELSGMPDLFAFWPFFMMYGFLTLLDYIVGRNLSQPPADLRDVKIYRWITLAAVPVQLAMIWWGLVHFTDDTFSPIGKAGWLLSVGALTGAVGITAAHELVHRASRLEQWAGGVLLASVCYGSFKVEHVYGHHVNVATPADASSARYGQSVYAFIPQAVWHNMTAGWRLAAARAIKRGRPGWQNEVLGWHALSAAFALAAFLGFGWIGLGFFLAQAAIAFCELEVVNYIEHYGLSRKREGDGYERVKPHHSWNSSYRMMNWYQLNLARHSDHHAHASRRYQELRHYEEAPQLPGGYSAMVMLALVPPLWFRVIHPRLARAANS